jgi:hypothetical protein
MNEQRNEPRTWTVPEPDGPRSTERIDGGFVLVNGWQVRYEPTTERRAAIEKAQRSSGPNRKARRAAFRCDASRSRRVEVRAEKRAGKFRGPYAYEWTAEERRTLRNAMKRQRREGR